jgi:DnaJ-class molecular chaperone
LEMPGREVRNMRRSPRAYPEEIVVESLGELEDRIIGRAGNKVLVRCDLCRGSGKYPWWTSICRACKGKGTFWIETPIRICAFCQGTGMQPYTRSELHCLACDGKGVVRVIEPSKECPLCHGTGLTMFTRPVLACGMCKGQGVIPEIPAAEVKGRMGREKRARDTKAATSTKKKGKEHNKDD